MTELGVRAIIRDINGKVLLIKNSRGINKAKWVLPGGRVDDKELAKDAVKREIKEELGLIFKPEFLAYSQDLTISRHIDYLTLYFVGKSYGKLKIEKNEISDYGYFSLKEIRKLKMGKGYKEILLNEL